MSGISKTKELHKLGVRRAKSFPNLRLVIESRVTCALATIVSAGCVFAEDSRSKLVVLLYLDSILYRV
jgi:hypothetical protein